MSEETSSCPLGQTRSAVRSVVVAFNQGNYEELETLFAQEPFFRWYTSPGPGRRWIKDEQRAALIPYFRKRRAHDDKLHLLSLHTGPLAEHWTNFSFEARRSAADYRAGEWFRLNGKGAAICQTGRPELTVFTLGRPKH